MFFWSDVFGEDGIFYSDFGNQFHYKEDVPATNNDSSSSSNGNNSSSNSSSGRNNIANEIKQISFPPLETVLGKKWNESISRFFPLSLVMVKERIINRFRLFSSLIFQFSKLRLQ